jgi:hypothetical protein
MKNRDKDSKDNKQQGQQQPKAKSKGKFSYSHVTCRGKKTPKSYSIPNSIAKDREGQEINLQPRVRGKKQKK